LLVRELRDHAELLGKFASASERRATSDIKDTATHKHQVHIVAGDETNPVLLACKKCTKVWTAKQAGMEYDPTDRILIQATNGQLVFVAGTAETTLMVKAGPTSAQGKALVSARLMLTAISVLRGTDEVTVEIDADGATFQVGAAKLRMPNVDSKMPRWHRPFRMDHGIVVPAKEWASISKALEGTAGNYWPYSHISLSGSATSARLTAMQRTIYQSMLLGTWDTLPHADIGGIPVKFFTATKYIVGEVQLSWNGDLVQIVSGPYTAAARLVTELAAWPAPEVFAPIAKIADMPTHTMVISRKTLLDIVKGFSLKDEYSRIILDVKGQTLTVRPFERTEAAMTVPVEAQGGDAELHLASGLLQQMLKLDLGKTVTIAWVSGANAPVRLTGDKLWSTYLAPLLMR
jgi:hypothetical protein